MVIEALLFITIAMPLPIRECDTDGDCQDAAEEIGCREYWSLRRPTVRFVCDRAAYLAAVRAASSEEGKQ